MTPLTDQKLEQLANSAFLRVAQLAVTAIAIPLLGWGGSAVLDRLSMIENAIMGATATAATVELRLTNIERGNSDRDLALRLLTERSLKHDFEIRALNNATKPR